ncbi:RHS repeat domain-containing protein, partial [Parachitinimonas caeni]
QTEYDIAGRITKTVRYATPAKLSVVAPLFSPVSGMAGQNLSPAQTQDILKEAGELQKSDANRVERFWYDTAGRLILSADAGGMLTERTYDKSGNVLRQVQYATPVSEATLSQNETKVGKLVDPVTGKDTLQINGAEAVLANAL